MTVSNDIPKKMVLVAGSRVEDGLGFRLDHYASGDQDLCLILTDAMVQALADDGVTPDNGPREAILARYEAQSCILTMYPRTLKAGSSYFGKPKYFVKRISVENAFPICSQDEDGTFNLQLKQLPAGFVQDLYEGFGLIYMLRFIVEAIEELSEIEEIRICDDEDTSVQGSMFRLPLAVYNRARKTLNRTHRAAVNFANEEKRTYLRLELLETNLPEADQGPQFRRTFGDLKDVLDTAINARGRKSKARSSNMSAAVQTVKTSAKELISDYPEEIFELNREIELELPPKRMARLNASGLYGVLISLRQRIRSHGQPMAKMDIRASGAP